MFSHEHLAPAVGFRVVVVQHSGIVRTGILREVNLVWQPIEDGGGPRAVARIEVPEVPGFESRGGLPAYDVLVSVESIESVEVHAS